MSWDRATFGFTQSCHQNWRFFKWKFVTHHFIRGFHCSYFRITALIPNNESVLSSHCQTIRFTGPDPTNGRLWLYLLLMPGIRRLRDPFGPRGFKSGPPSHSVLRLTRFCFLTLAAFKYKYFMCDVNYHFASSWSINRGTHLGWFLHECILIKCNRWRIQSLVIELSAFFMWHEGISRALRASLRRCLETQRAVTEAASECLDG